MSRSLAGLRPTGFHMTRFSFSNPIPISLGNLRLWLLLTAILLLVGVVYLGQSSQAALTGRRIQDKQERLDRVNREIVQLRMDIATLSAPDRIDARARALGLHPPRPDQSKYLVVSNYPVEPAVAAALPSEVRPLQANNWLQELLNRLGLTASGHSAEATTGQ